MIFVMKETLLTDLFWNAGFFLILPALIIPLLKYFKIPSALGYLVMGVVLGPYALGALAESYPVLDFITFKETQEIKILAELGIVLLLFIIGLEITPRRLWQMRSLVFGLGGTQVIVTSIVIGTIAFLWGNNVQVSLLLGLSLALSSTAIIIQWIHENKLFATPAGRSSFSVLLFQDLAVIPILLLLTIMGSEMEGNISSYVSISLLKMVVTVLGIYFVGKILLKPVFLFANKYGGAEVFIALILLVITFSATAAALAGLSMALGAFVAGLLLADTEYKHEISSLILPFKSMLIGIFFLSFGMGINLNFIADRPFWLLGSVFGLMLIKASIIFCVCKIWKQTTAVSAENAVLLSQAGEFGLLVVGTSLTLGLMQEDVGQFMLIMVGITMLFAPMLAPVARKIGGVLEDRNQKNHPLRPSEFEDKKNHVVILGYGRVGRDVSDKLGQEGYEVFAIEKNIEKVEHAQKDYSPVYLGDVAKKATLESANISEALCVVVTLDDIEVTKNIIVSIRKIDKDVPIVIRAHSISDQNSFNEFKNVDAIAENTLISEKLAEKIFSKCTSYEQ